MERSEVYENQEKLVGLFFLRDLEKKIKDDIEDEELTFNIGKKGVRVQINFDFNFQEIISKLPKTYDQRDSNIWSYKIDCTDVDFNGKVIFSNMTFQNDADFSGAKFKEADFMGANFTKGAKFFKTTFDKYTDFCCAIFNEEANFMGAIFNEEADSKNEADFRQATFHKKAYFMKATFNKKANFSNTTFTENAYFHSETFNGKTNFNKKANFNFATFHKKANFNFATFNEDADFSNATFQNADFSKINFTEANFSDATFQNKTDFTGVTIENTLKFDNITLDNKPYIFFKDIINNEKKNSKIEIINTVINGRIDFNNVKIKEINFEGSNVMILGVLNRINFEADCANWGTASFLKHEELKKDNIIKALEYKAIEKDEYKKFIKKRRKEIADKLEKLEHKNKKKNKIIVSIIKLLRIIIIPFLIIIKVFKALKIFFLGEKENDEIGTVNEKEKLKAEKDKYWWEDMSIRLSRLSNNHGQNWGQAVLFTILSGAFFFAIFYAPNPIIQFFDPDAVQTTWKGFFSSLFMYYIPVDFNSLKDYLGRSDLKEWLKTCGVAVYIIGKITISYGYVEVVQAFRKLK